MKKITIFFIILFIAGIAGANDLYVAIKDGEPQGTVRIADDKIDDWKKDFEIIKVDESYSGKHGYEIKFDGSSVRHATEEEINEYKQLQNEEIKIKQKDLFLEILGITEEHLNKIKALK